METVCWQYLLKKISEEGAVRIIKKKTVVGGRAFTVPNSAEGHSQKDKVWYNIADKLERQLNHFIMQNRKTIEKNS